VGKSPAFQFYPADFLMGALTFTLAERGAYISLLCYQWDNGSVPDDLATLGVIFNTKRAETKRIWEKIQQKFPQTPDGVRCNSRLEIERKKQEEFKRTRAENGAKGGRPKSTRFPESKLPETTRLAKPNLDESSLSSSSSSIRKREATPPVPRLVEPGGPGHRRNLNAFWTGAIFDVPQKWATETIRESNGKLTEAKLLDFCRWLHARVEADGTDITQECGGRKWTYLTRELAVWRESEKDDAYIERLRQSTAAFEARIDPANWGAAK
jgi:uncharacterized protein YdaU (DUF1376 family)